MGDILNCKFIFIIFSTIQIISYRTQYVAIKNITSGIINSRYYTLNCIRWYKVIIRPKEKQIIAISFHQTLVHCIIDTLVRFRNKVINAIIITANYIASFIPASTIYDYILNIPISLTSYRAQCFFNCILCIEAYGNYTDFHAFIFTFLFVIRRLPYE